MNTKLYLESKTVKRIQDNANGRARTIEEYLEEVMKEDKLTIEEIREVVKEAMTEVLEDFISGLKEEAKESEYERLREKWQKIIGNENYTCLEDREEQEESTKCSKG